MWFLIAAYILHDLMLFNFAVFFCNALICGVVFFAKIGCSRFSFVLFNVHIDLTPLDFKVG
ncbi:hypothetical protein BBD28_00775 [Elizabethkingia anophelis]|nr:hypothetical protein BBD28_00775 [Elizabethkingia anophelis]KUY22430.1 hypothetical protein ATB94_14065 [Elizabethkingia anophelis]MDV3746679.1 hypothetical protein [Elizabethkingia anophelis]